MQIQKILLPEPGVCAESNMFFHGDSSNFICNTVKNELIFDKDAQVSFDTYFNSFTIFKWAKYTNINNLKLSLKLKGKFVIRLYNYRCYGEIVDCKVIGKYDFDSDNAAEITVEFPSFYQSGLCFFDLWALEDNSIFYGGSYETDIDDEKLNKVNIAINMCTYMREKYVERTVDLLNNGMLSDKNMPINGHVHLYITDNGSSIDYKRLQSDKIHITLQGDYGGAGGFTRGLMEITQDKAKYDFTHIIMMDDDILIQQEAILRTYSFLRLIKPAYKDSFIGGALLRTDIQNIQYICGGEWNTKKSYIMHKLNNNLDFIENVMSNELEDGAKINGWWYHCIPISVVQDNNLPNPVFFHMDDCEYDIRNCKNLITLNGICVWHEPFEYKPGSYVKYYNTRNVAITHAIHYREFDKKQMIDFFLECLQIELDCYRYKEAELVLRGAEDFMKGIEWLKTTEPISLFEDVVASGYKKVPVETLSMRFDLSQYYESYFYHEDSKKEKLRIKTKNGYTKKPDHDAIVPMFGPHPGCFYRANRVLNYDMITGKAYITQRDNKQYNELQKRFKQLVKDINRNYESVAEGYRSGISALRTREFWTGYLKINDEEN